MHYLQSIPITTSMACSIPRIGKTFWNCCGTLLSNADLSLCSVSFNGAEAWIWRSGTTWPETLMSSLQWTVNTSPGLLLLCSWIDWLLVVTLIKWTVSGYFVIKWSNVLCLWLCHSAYCISPLKNVCTAFSLSTVLTKFKSSCSARGSVTLAFSLVTTTSDPKGRP